MLRVNPCPDKYKNEKGQISVFIGLTFLVLFTLFAMTINVAMVVHDKINVQNAADFASIYVAQKQAEQLNAIAHLNYQIRQAHKLMTYRYIVLGTAGILDGGAVAPGGVENSETEYELANKVKYAACYSSRVVFKDIINDNWCRKERYDLSFNGIPHLNVVNGMWGGNATLRRTTIELGLKIQSDALKANAFDWWMVNTALAAYRVQVAYRKNLIKALATNLSRPINNSSGGMKDLDGKSVYLGARKTFEFNLSESNRTTEPSAFQVYNSLQGIDQKTWLPEIKTWIALLYADRRLLQGAGTGGDFDKIIKRFNFKMPESWDSPLSAAARKWLDDEADQDGFLRRFAPGDYIDFPEGSDFEDILGFEKNPWYMVYNRVRATTRSFALFSPTGGVDISAQAFSKPFGGRIGPWYSKNWSSGSPTSTGPKTVQLWSPRKERQGEQPPQDDTISPNSPKYPGDKLGWSSRLAVTSTGKIGNGVHVSTNDYRHTVQELFHNNGSGDALAKNAMREKEMAAIAPDLFDIYYYSVESNFHENYLHEKLDKWLMNEAQFKEMPKPKPKIWRDLGYIEGAGQTQAFSVHNQLTMSLRSTLGSQLFYALESSDDKGRANLLTSWVGGIEVADYRSPASGSVSTRFGKCKTFKTNGSHPKNAPGECLEDGGRTGYSVKMVSKDFLASPSLTIGGSQGRILNPPPD